MYCNISHFSKVLVTQLHFYGRPNLVPVFSNQNKYKENFHFLEKMAKNWNSMQRCFTAGHCRGSRHPEQQEWPRQVPSQNHTLHLKIRPPEFLRCLWASALYVDLFWASVNKMCSKVSENPKRWYLESGNTQKIFHIH